jgi:tetratricopeptide (TPR) repeat protein
LIRQRQALAEAATAAGLDDLAVSLLEKADAPETLLRLGDLLAGKKQWAKAAERYRQAWRKTMTLNDPLPVAKHVNPLPLYLAGDALVKAGQEKEGKKLIEQSHWLPLGDSLARFTFLRALTERGHTEAAHRETDLLLRVSEPNSYYSGAAARRLAIVAAQHKDYLKAADGFEQSMLRCLHPTTNFVQSPAYVAVPAQVHQMRASGLLASGKFEEARKHIELTRTFLPGNVELPIKLVPELERRGHKKEAAALFETSYGTYEKVCGEYPRCAWAHNSAAWMSACCRRNLDKALAHAQKAVELTPENAGYLDTLAEVHFQRGDKEKAVALQKRVIELDPKKPYFRKQLKRLEAGDPSAERPPENDD